MYRHRNIKDIQKIDICDYVREFLSYMREEKAIFVSANSYENAEYLKGLLCDPSYTVFRIVKGIGISFPRWGEQKVEHVPSNFGKGKGYIFYFICSGCSRRVKYLYDGKLSYSPLCRICCNLSYKAPTRRARELSRLVHKPNLSKEDKCWLLKKVGITRDDMLKEDKFY